MIAELPFNSSSIFEAEKLFNDPTLDETAKNLESFFLFNALISESFQFNQNKNNNKKMWGV